MGKEAPGNKPEVTTVWGAGKNLMKEQAEAGQAVTRGEPASVHQGLEDAKGRHRSPWWWVPSTYYAEGIPYIVVNVVSVVMYQRMGVSNRDIAFFTSWLYLPWMLKPLWSPLVDLIKTKRWWIIVMQLLVGAGLAGIALTIPMPAWFRLTMICFWLLAFFSATHDIACDGFYMLGLTKHQQAWFVGVRSTFYRLAKLTGTGLLVILAGYIESHSGLPAVTVHVKAVKSVERATQLGLTVVPADRIAYLAEEDMDIEAEMDRMTSAIQPEEAPLRLVPSSTDLAIPIKSLEPALATQVIALAREWNRVQGQEPPESAEKKEKTRGPIGRLWTGAIAQPLEGWLKANFAPQPPETLTVAGNLSVLFFHLSAPPEAGQEVVVNFGRKSGDKSLNLMEGGRFVFTEENWNRPVMSILQLHHHLRQESEGTFKALAGNIPLSWIITFFLLSALFIGLFVFHSFVLPYPFADKGSHSDRSGGGGLKAISTFARETLDIFISFFKKKGILYMLAFLLLYRLGEAQLMKMAPPFLLDSQENGGLALTTGQVGTAYGVVGLVSLTIGGILGGIMAARHGLKTWIWWMTIAINFPDATYVLLSQMQPDSFLLVNICVGIEQFGYGFGVTAFMLYMIYCAEGEYKTVHFAIATAFMAAGMMIPGMFSGWIQECIGYQNFFVWVLICTIPGFLLLLFIPLDPHFGKKERKTV